MLKAVFLSLFIMLQISYAKDEIHFGVFAYLGYEDTKKRYQPLVDYLNTKLQKKVVLEVLTQDEMDEKIKKGELDVATTNPTHFLVIRQQYKLSGAVATLVSSHNKTPVSRLGGVIFVTADSKIRELADLKNKTILTPSVKHMGGYRAQAYELYKKGINLSRGDAKVVETKGGHQDVVRAVLDKKADAGFIRDGVVEHMIERGELDRDSIFIINEQKDSGHSFVVSTPLYPEWPVFTFAHSNEADVRHIVAALFSLEPDSKYAVDAQMYGYTLPADYLPVEDLARALRLPPFDKVADISYEDVWEQYKVAVIFIFTALVALVAYYLMEQKRRRLFESLLSNIGDGVYGVDEKGRCTWINQKALDMIGFKKQEVLFRDQHALFHHHRPSKEDYDVCDCPIHKTLKDRQIRTVDEYFIRKDGSFFPVALTAAPIKDSGGAIVIFRDISEQKRQRDELVSSKQRLLNIIEATNVGTWEWNIKTGETIFSDRWAQMLGYDLSEISPVSIQTWSSFVHPDDLVKSEELLSRHFKKELDYYEIECRFRHKDGRWIWVLDRGRVTVWDDDSKPLWMYGTHQDITSKKVAEDSVRKSEESLKKAQSIARLGSWELDLQTNELVWSDEVYRIFELDKESFLSSYDSFLEHIHPDDRDSVISAFVDSVKTRRQYAITHRLMMPDGRIKWVSEIGDIEYANDKTPIIGRGTVQDITEQVKIMHELQEAKKRAEEASVAKSQFLANMSHEIRTPMNAIIGLSELAIDEDDESSHKEYLAKINRSSKLLLRIINDILDYSKIEADKLELESEPFEIKDMLSGLSVLFEKDAREKNIDLRFEIADDVPAVVIGDFIRLTQVLANLIGNSIKFTNSGFVKVSLFVKERADKSVFLGFCMEDSGIGMSEEQVSRLFRPFTQADASTTRKYGGTGLGLVIAKKIINAMGGDIEVLSQPDIGTKFEFFIKVELQEDFPKGLSSNKALQAPAGLSGVSLLLVEDNEVNQEIAKKMLTRLGASVEIANNGKEGVECVKARNGRFDIILMDIQMPIMSGYEASLKIKEIYPNIPIVALTAAATVEDRQKAIDAGMDEHISKPIDSDRMCSVIMDLLDIKPTIDSNMPQPRKDEKQRADVSVLPIDSQKLMELIGYDEALFEKLIDIFLSDLANKFTTLPNLIKSKDQRAADLAHALKGVSGNMFCPNLYDTAMEIDKKLKNSDVVEQELIDDLEQNIQKTIEAIKSYRDGTKSTHGRRLPNRELDAIVKDVMQKLKKAEMPKSETIEDLYASLAGIVGDEEFLRLKNLIDSFEYDDAYEMLVGLKLRGVIK